MTDGLFDVSGRIALITGSGQGIGFALARGLGEAGATVVLNGRREGPLKDAAAALGKDGITAHIAPFDVSDEAGVGAAVEHIEKDIGPIGVLVNNAGIQNRQPLEEFPFEEWRAMLAIHLDGAFLVGRAVAKGMIARRAGKIINICSVMSELGRAGVAPYAAAKGGLKMLTKGMCAEWARHDIQVNGIGAGYFRTELTRALTENKEFTSWLAARTPAGRWGDVGELVGAAVFLASPASSFVNGHILYVDGGLTASV